MWGSTIFSWLASFSIYKFQYMNVSPSLSLTKPLTPINAAKPLSGKSYGSLLYSGLSGHNFFWFRFGKFCNRSVNSINVWVFFEKHIKNKYLCCPDKNQHYFCKSCFPVINLIVGSRNIIEVSKNISL